MNVATVANTESDALFSAPRFIESAVNRIFAELSAAAHQWAEFAGKICDPRNTQLLDHPTPEYVSEHRQTVQAWVAFGELASTVMHSPAFPDRELSKLVDATLQMLRDCLDLWHGEPITEAEAEAIIQKCFPE